MYNFTLKLFVFLLILTSINIHSQCTETAFGFGNNSSIPRYNISGDVSVTLNTDNTITLNLGSNFSTAAGPDVRAYLIKSNGLTDTQIGQTRITNLENIQFDLIAASGEQSFTIDAPLNEEISSYDKILFYCLQFKQFWDVGSFNAFTSNSCAVLSTEDNTLTSVDIYPNPATSNIQLTNLNSDATEIRIFDFSGKKVFQQLNGNTQNFIDVSNLKTGIYVLSVIENNKQFSKKLIIQ